MQSTKYLLDVHTRSIGLVEWQFMCRTVINTVHGSESDTHTAQVYSQNVHRTSL